LAETLEIDYKPQPKQLLLSECPANEILFGGSAGPGKAGSLDSIVMTPFGPKQMRDMKVGSQVSNPDGSIARVIQVHPQGVQPLYRVSFADGSSTECTLDHLWQWKMSSRRRFVKVKEHEHLPEFKVSTTAELKAYVDKQIAEKAAGRRPYWPLIPMTKPVVFTPPTGHAGNRASRTIDPYTLGVILGDGSITQRTVNFATGDPYIAARVKGVGDDRVNSLSRDISYSIVGGETVAALEGLKLMGCGAATKFIPRSYKVAPLEDRMEILRGLMDTDGTVDHRSGWCSYTTISKQLAEDVRWIIQSIGGRATISTKNPTFTDTSGEKKNGQLAYVLHIQTPKDSEIFSLPRKIALCVDEFNGGVSKLCRRVVGIKYSRDAEAQCITVDNPNGLYITDDFIVTHNSHAIRYESLIWAMRIPKLQVYLFRRIYPELERNHILPILMEWGNKYGEYSDRKRRYVLSNGSIIHFCHAQYEQDIMGYHGAEIHLLVVDELSTFTEFQYTYLRNRVRCALEIPEQYIGKVPGIICGSNPGGPGHEFCKSMFVDFCIIDTDEAVKRMREPELYGPVYEHPHRRLGHTIYYGLRKAPDEEGGMVRAYIPALLEDNPILMERDPGYINRVKAMPEPYRSAYLDGDWEIFVGQMFNFSRKHHVCPKHEVPAHAPIYFGFDWGFGKPFSCNWFYTDADGRLYLFSEWYGFTGVPDTGLRMSDSQIAEGIIKHEKLIGLRTETGGMVVNGFDCGVPIRPVEYILSPDCFSRKPSYMGGGQGPSTDEVFAMYGINGYPGDATRNQKIKQFHERLRVPENGDQPMFQVFETCPQFIRTIPQLQQSQTDPEDVDGKAEDHIYDAVSLVFMSRPVELKMPNEKLSPTDLRLERLKAMGGDPFEDYAGYHAGVEMELLDGEDGDDLVDTVF